MRCQFYIVKLESFTIQGLPTRAKKGLPTEVTFWTFWSHFKHCASLHLSLCVDIVKYLDGALVRKISKRHFFEDIWNSFHEGTQMGPEPHQLFSFWDIYTNAVARDIQSFGRNGPWQPGCLSFGQNFFVKFAGTCDEQMLKISRRYLDFCLIYS